MGGLVSETVVSLIPHEISWQAPTVAACIECLIDLPPSLSLQSAHHFTPNPYIELHYFQLIKYFHWHSQALLSANCHCTHIGHFWNVCLD